jgi:hypothetical protein
VKSRHPFLSVLIRGAAENALIIIVALAMLAFILRKERACEARECFDGLTSVYLGRKCVCLPEARP